MKFRISCYLLALSLIGSSAVHAELIQLRLKGDLGSGVEEFSETTITLAEGDVAQQISGAGYSSAYLQVTIGTEIYYMPSVGNTSSDRFLPTFLGPASIKLTNKSSDSNSSPGQIPHIALFSVSRGGLPSGGIAVPADDPTATFEVFMEASTDMETWVRVIPGDYDASGGAKFFRVRMVKK